VNPVERYRPTTYNRTGRHSSPKNICTRKFPNCQERRQHCHQDAGAGYPKGEAPNHLRIQKSAPLSAFRILQISLPCFVRTTCVSGWVLIDSSLFVNTHPLTQVVLTRAI